MSIKYKLFFFILTGLLSHTVYAQRNIVLLNNDWLFHKGDVDSANDWKAISIPHDWSILEAFDSIAGTTHNQGSLPAGIGWYKKQFRLNNSHKNKNIRLYFDGVFQRCSIWINGRLIKKHANGYVSFFVDINEFVKFDAPNELIVRVDNSQQPNSRWYTGSGIYRKVWLDLSGQTHLSSWDVQISTKGEELIIKGKINGDEKGCKLFVQLNTVFLKGESKRVGQDSFLWRGVVKNVKKWTPENPYIYRLKISLNQNKKNLDQLNYNIGFRDIHFDANKGFFLNGRHYLIKGVCMHHDLGALGAAVYPAAIKRQLKILKEMGANAIRTSHNPPSVEFLNICDSMGFLVMNELYDSWAKKKNKFDQSLDFKENWKDDVENWIKRDRNHPSIIAWSIGNEIREQFDSTGITIAKELAARVKEFDRTRPVTSALTENIPEKNFIVQSGALDILGFNYKHQDYALLPKRFPGKAILATETASAFSSRGEYDLPADSIRVWPPDSKPFTGGRKDHQVSAYDHVYAYWGTSHENAWLSVKQNPFLAGAFVWSGFDFLGEPIPYNWPSRSSYYGIVDLAGFKKDVYYMYQSEWTTQAVLHVLPHWNWSKGDLVDVWAYAGGADEVRLYVNNKYLGKRSTSENVLHLSWKIPFEPGVLKAISYRSGKIVKEVSVKTATAPAQLKIVKTERFDNGDSFDLIFAEIAVLDNKQQIVPDSNIEISTMVSGAELLVMDNGSAVDQASFQTNKRMAYNGRLLVILKAKKGSEGTVMLNCRSESIKPLTIKL